MNEVSMTLFLPSLELTGPPTRTGKMMDRTSKNTERNKDSRPGSGQNWQSFEADGATLRRSNQDLAK